MSWPEASSLFSDSEAYHEQIGQISNSNGSLDMAYPMGILRALGDATELASS